jgi:hypothetical protein
MKKLTIAMLGVMILATACHKKRHVVIAEENNGNRLKIEYVGRVEFNNEGTAIKRITPNDGYVKYVKNDNGFMAERNKRGIITYEFNDGPRKSLVNDIERQFLIVAIKDMINMAITTIKTKKHPGLPGCFYD